MATIIRAIESHSVHMNPGHQKHWAVGGRITFLLADCGHQVTRKLSQGMPKTMRVRCDECTSLANGARHRTGRADGGWDSWTWDAEKGLPVCRVVPPKG